MPQFCRKICNAVKRQVKDCVVSSGKLSEESLVLLTKPLVNNLIVKRFRHF